MASSKPHRYEIDMVRALTIVGVMSVHTTWFTNSSTGFWPNMVMDCLHYTREVFLFMTAFVLFYNYYHRPANWPQFWKKRFLLIGVPYVVWSAAYLLYGGQYSPGLGGYLATLGHDLITGTAWFHLYYLLITMQIYVIMPIFVWIVKKTEGYHLWLMTAAVVLEAAMMYAMQYQIAWMSSWWGPLGVLVQYRGQVFFTYEAYLMAGALLAVHYEAVHRFVVQRARIIGWALVASLAAMAASFALSVQVAHDSVSFASDVLQPLLVPYALLVIAVSYLIGHRWNLRRAELPRLSALVLIISDLSFGLYLMHPMILQEYTDYVTPLLASVPRLIVTPATVLAVLATSLFFTRMISLTPLSPWILGRAQMPLRRRVEVKTAVAQPAAAAGSSHSA
ncbi:MAG: acyltransferase [Clostridia bacterium]